MIRLGPNGVFCFQVTAHRIAPITGVHIHQAPPGHTGGHAVDLFARVITRGDGSQVFVGCTRTSQAEAIATNPGAYYLNVHTDEFPPGALRGQLG